VARSHLRLAAVVFIVAVGLRLLHVWQIRASPFFDVLLGDAKAYDEWAQRIASGEWVGAEVFYQAPLYPYFLGVIYSGLGRDLLTVRVVQTLIGAASCVLVTLTAWRLFSTRAALIAGFGMAIYAPAIFFDGLIQKSVLDVFFMSLTIWILSGLVSGEPRVPGAEAFRKRGRGSGRGSRRSRLDVHFIALGLTMAALSLTRENALVLVAVVLSWILFGVTRDIGRARAAAAFVAGLAILLLPVAARNYAVGGGFHLTTAQFGPNFFIGNNPRSDGTYSSLRPGRGSPEYERRDATELAERAMGRSLTPGEVSSYWTDRAMSFVTSQPGAWSALMGRKLLLLVNAGEMLDTESQASYAEWSWPLRATGWLTHFGVLVPLAAAGMWVAWPDRRRLAIFYAMTAAYAVSVVIFYVFARYRFPLVPLLLLFASAGLAEATGLWKRKTEKLAIAGTIATVAIVSNWPLLSTPLMKAITESNLAAGLYERGRTDEAIAHYQRAIALRPDYAPAHGNMGAALRAKGRSADAVAAHRQALVLQPDNPDTHFNLANALLDLNRPQEAAEHFRLAGRQAPSSVNVENNLGIALAAEGKLSEAVAAFRRAIAADPTSARAHRNLGDALTSLGQLDEGLSALRRATELEPANATFRYDLAVALLEGGRTAPAVAEFRAALKIDPAFAAAHNNLGVALASTGQLDEAVSHFRQALKIQPDYADAQRNLEMATRR
jgi:tetratricopeptide (TPR) repeat protein